MMKHNFFLLFMRGFLLYWFFEFLIRIDNFFCFASYLMEMLIRIEIFCRLTGALHFIEHIACHALKLAEQILAICFKSLIILNKNFYAFLHIFHYLLCAYFRFFKCIFCF